MGKTRKENKKRKGGGMCIDRNEHPDFVSVKIIFFSLLLTFDIWVKPMHTSERKKERKGEREKNSDMRISYLSFSIFFSYVKLK